MKFPWQRQTRAPAASVDNRPRLINIGVEPVMFNGQVTLYKIVIQFDRKSIVVGRMSHKDAADALVAELKKGLL